MTHAALSSDAGGVESTASACNRCGVSPAAPVHSPPHAQLCGTSVAFAPRGWLGGCVATLPCRHPAQQHSAGMAARSCWGCMHTAVCQGSSQQQQPGIFLGAVVEGSFQGEAGWLFGGAACLFVGALGCCNLTFFAMLWCGSLRTRTVSSRQNPVSCHNPPLPCCLLCAVCPSTLSRNLELPAGSSLAAWKAVI